jgi:hypothetical protein
MVKFTFDYGSKIDTNLTADWTQKSPDDHTVYAWQNYLKTHHNAIDSLENPRGTEIFFRTEEELTFFILRWS